MKKNKEVELQQYIAEEIIPFEKLPAGIKEGVFEFADFRQELIKESDRGCALLAASHLEHMLEKALRSTLAGSSKHLKSLFDFNGPLGTFSSRILMSHSVGILSKYELHDIQLVRKIRNEYGHTPKIISFEDDKIKSLCNQLKLVGNTHLNNPRKRFITTVAFLTGGFEGIAIKHKRIAEKKEIDINQTQSTVDKLMEVAKLLFPEIFPKD